MRTNLALNDRQAAFARYLVDGRHYLEAYRLAGYTGGQPQASFLTRHPAVSAAIKAEMTRRLQDEDAPAARKLLRRFVDDEQCDKKLRVDCAKTLLSRGGYVEPKAADPVAPGTKEPSEMSGKELDDMIDRLRTELRQRETKAIDITPTALDPWDE